MNRSQFYIIPVIGNTYHIYNYDYLYLKLNNPHNLILNQIFFGYNNIKNSYYYINSYILYTYHIN